VTPPIPPQPQPARAVEEVPVEGCSAVVHPGWREAFPWLVQGTTTAGNPHDPFDLGLFSDATPARGVMEHWHRLRVGAGMTTVALAHQVHGSAVRWHRAGPPGMHVAEPCDGHATADGGVLLAVTVADCVPVSVVDPERRAVALAHAGWRGTAAGVLERAIAVLVERAASRPEDLHVHLGPAICRDCYEVGPEVFQALGVPVPPAPARLDLRAALAARARAAGVAPRRITASSHCTRCGHGFFSHRGGSRARQAGFLGARRG
jgi:purine-nucleoside/S-methyl-5'-thioadenosine phosphorylase / adenosine deaminase